MKKIKRIAGVICLVAASTQAALVYDIEALTQTDAAVANAAVSTTNSPNIDVAGGFGADLSTNPANNGTSVSHAFTYFDAANNVTWGYTLTLTAAADMDGFGNGFGVTGNGNNDWNPGDSATLSLSGQFATANNAGESVDSFSILLDRVQMTGFTDAQGAYSVLANGSTLNSTVGGLDLGTDADSSIVVTALTGAGPDNKWRFGKVGVHTEVTVIPEPATMGMLGAFGVGILWIRRRFCA